MMNAVYYWTEDGHGERCQVEFGTAKEETRCYHCDGIVEQGTEIATLTTRHEETYLLHKHCAEKGCNFNIKDKEHYIWKAKNQRGLSDAEINYFLNNHPNFTLLPYYATWLKHGASKEEALQAVIEQFGKE